MARGPYWKQDEITMLRAYAGTMPAKVLARKLGRPLGSMYVKACLSGISLRCKSSSPQAGTASSDLAFRQPALLES